MDRFRPPTVSDEFTLCAGCGKRYHYTALDDDGYCQDCAPETESETNEPMKTSKHIRWAAPLVIVAALLPLLPTMYWQFYWFNHRIMHKVATWIS